MRTLLLNQFFHPDTSPTSQLLTDVARHLVATGDSVRVVRGSSSYAELDLEDPPRVDVVNVPNFRFSHGILGRISSYASFLVGAVWCGFRGPRPDVVLTLTTPPLLSVVGALIKRFRGSRHLIWEMDVYPDVAVELGVLSERSAVGRAVGAALDAARRNADGVIVLGESMKERLIARGTPPAKICVAENWADGRQIQALPFPPNQPLTVLYSGNLGLAHDIQTVRDAIHHFGSDSRFQFNFSGGGPERESLEAFCHGETLANVSFTGYRPRKELSASLGSCHVGLVTQKPATLGCVVPSKTYGLMAAGRPILYVGPRQATPARIIERFRCGWQIDPGDTPALIALLESLAANPALVHEAGAHGREAFLQHYDLPIGVARVCSILAASPSKADTKAGKFAVNHRPPANAGQNLGPVPVRRPS